MDFHERQLERQSFTQRSLLVASLLLIFIVVILFRTFSLQISNFTEFDEASLNNRTYSVPVQPLRGKILDRNGEVISENIATFDLVTTPRDIKDVDAFIEKIEKIIDLDKDEIDLYIKNFNSKAFFNRELVLKKNLSEIEIARFEVRGFEHKEAFVGKRFRRVSRYDEIFSHVLGYTGSARENNLDEQNRFRSNSWRDAVFSYANGLIEGKAGLEKTYNQSLTGTFGIKQFEVDARGRLVKELSYTPPINGENILTTLDIDAQKVAANQLGKRKGSIVVVDVETGGIVAIYSYPTFSVNKMANGISQLDYEDLINDPDKPFFDRSVAGRYPPASTIKPLVGIHALNRGQISWTTKIDDPGFFELPEDGRIFRSWGEIAHGLINLNQALIRSSNTYFFNLAYNSGINELADDFEKFGFGSTVCVDCILEDGGLVPRPQWKMNNLNFGWFKGDTVNIGVGQGYISATPIQLAHYTAALANKGTKKPLFLNNALSGKVPSSEIELENFNQRDWRLLHKAMESVVESDYGTARRIRDQKDFLIAAKTGTGEIISLDSREEYERIREDQGLRDHAIIVAFAPAEKPKYAVSVIIENGESGGSVAGPVALRILKELLKE